MAGEFLIRWYSQRSPFGYPAFCSGGKSLYGFRYIIMCQLTQCKCTTGTRKVLQYTSTLYCTVLVLRCTTHRSRSAPAPSCCRAAAMVGRTVATASSPACALLSLPAPDRAGFFQERDVSPERNLRWSAGYAAVPVRGIADCCLG